ncbi:hypothetical protein ACFLX2_00005, partial [Candidatus Dependentiae bacterium]
RDIFLFRNSDNAQIAEFCLKIIEQRRFGRLHAGLERMNQACAARIAREREREQERARLAEEKARLEQERCEQERRDAELARELEQCGGIGIHANRVGTAVENLSHLTQDEIFFRLLGYENPELIAEQLKFQHADEGLVDAALVDLAQQRAGMQAGPYAAAAPAPATPHQARGRRRVLQEQFSMDDLQAIVLRIQTGADLDTLRTTEGDAIVDAALIQLRYGD